MGIDLGTANTLVCVKGQGIVLREPSVVAIDKESHNVIAIGVEAKKMLGKTPANIVAVRPLRNGVIADFEVTEQMIRYFIKKVHNRRSLLHPRIVIGIPSGITEVERRAVRESAEQAGAREVYLIEEPMAAAIGANLPINEPFGNMIVDIGGGTTEVAVICLGGMVVSRSLDVAGDEMDEAIVQYFRRKYNLLIGDMTAEDVKIRIGSVFPTFEEQSMEVKGRDQVTGLPKTITITSEEVRQSLAEPMKLIIEIIKETLEETPAELSADLVDRGIVLAGGGALLRGISDLISQETELPVNIAPEPLTCVAMGAGKYLEEIDNLRLRT
ncbi:MAG: rod shape-determining protein [Elusimicrobia bacterium RIFCSPLOWO2_01_FULL_64_13]|nr:MAG: rod shape-determining protein [Elusimicrobia bacterium RIFCSPHIGHO2_01_FULL_64_10]OGR96558.1 MAG: rod shape-determining protein [Elusimicrobia bacterium RIFCSPLOWO2_01_FULL_64_13]